MKKRPLVLFSATLLAGCATIATIKEPKLYSGIRKDIEAYHDCYVPVENQNGLVYRAGEFCILAMPFVYIDFPFSLVGDTLMLPIKAVQVAVSNE